MDTATLWQMLVIGVAMGSIYGLIGLGFNLIFYTTRVANFAQGEMMVIGLFTALTIYELFALPLWLMVVLALSISFIYGILLEELVVISSRGEESASAGLNWILAIFGLSIALRSLAGLIWGTSAVPFPNVLGDWPPIMVGNVLISVQYLAIVTVTVGITVLMEILASPRFRLGRAIRAVSFNTRAAELMGIRVKQINLLVFGLAGLLATAGGFLIVPVTFASADLGVDLGLKAIIAALFGGLGTVGFGVLTAGMVLGLLESMATLVIPAGYRSVLSFLVLILILLFRPGGLFGEKTAART